MLPEHQFPEHQFPGGILLPRHQFPEEIRCLEHQFPEEIRIPGKVLPVGFLLKPVKVSVPGIQLPSSERKMW